jgi:hypothetical protein
MIRESVIRRAINISQGKAEVRASTSSSAFDEETIKLIEKVVKNIQKLNVKGVPIQIEDCIFTNQRKEQRKKGCYGCGKKGHFVEVCPNKSTSKTRRKACKDKALTSLRSWDDSSSEDEVQLKRRGHKHSSSSSSRVCLMAQDNESSFSSESDSDDEMPSLNELVQENLKYTKICTRQQKKLKMLQEKLDSSQEAYKTLLEQYETFANLNVELSTKIEQLEASTTTNTCTINDEQHVKKNKKLKEKLASSQDGYKSLLAKMEIMCKHCDELTNKVANLEIIGTTPTKAPKKKSSIFKMSKKDASTSCNDLCDLSSPTCSQACFEKVVVETCKQEVAMENEKLKQEVTRLTKYLIQVQGKTEQTQLYQDNTVKGMKKLDEGQTLVCYVCHKEGHKSYECKVKNGGRARKKEKNKKQTSKLSNTYTNKVDKKASTPYLLKKNNNDKVVAIKVNKQANNGVKRFWVPKEIISNMKSTKNVWIPSGSEKSKGLRGIWRLGKVWVHFMGCITFYKGTAKWVSEHYGPKFPHPC